MSDTGKPAETDRPLQDPPKDHISDKDSDSAKSDKPGSGDAHDPDFLVVRPGAHDPDFRVARHAGPHFRRVVRPGPHDPDFRMVRPGPHDPDFRRGRTE